MKYFSDWKTYAATKLIWKTSIYFDWAVMIVYLKNINWSCIVECVNLPLLLSTWKLPMIFEEGKRKIVLFIKSNLMLEKNGLGLANTREKLDNYTESHCSHPEKIERKMVQV